MTTGYLSSFYNVTTDEASTLKFMLLFKLVREMLNN